MDAISESRELSGSRNVSGSFQLPGPNRRQIAGLAVGECCFRSERLNFDTLTRTELQATNEALPSAITPSAHRAAAQTGNIYTIEAGKWRTVSRALVVTVIVTRTP